ncbi:MAG: hypothetical protein ABFS21_04285 [Actinomycetota bacterium]
METSIKLGGADCEALGNGWLVQPVNAWSSLAYAVVGAVLIIAALSRTGRERTLSITFGVILVLTGAGSFLYHGPQTPVAHFAHDISFLAALWFLVLLNLAASTYLPRKVLPIAFVGVVAILAVALLAWPSLTNIHTGVAVLALGASDLLRRRAGGFAHTWHNAAALALLASLLFNALGRTDAPTCDPSDLFQFHGLWHAFSAIALGAYFVAALRTEGPDTP